jgi:hypothetical protein
MNASSPLAIDFVLSSSLRGLSHASRRNAQEVRDGERLRYTVVYRTASGALAGRAEVSRYNSSDTLAEAREHLVRIEGLNPGKSYAIVDRLLRVEVA